MSEAQKYYLTATGYLMEGEQLGRISVYLSSDYDQLKAANYLQEVRLKDAFEVIDQLKEAYEGAESQAEYQRGRAEHFMLERDTLRKQLTESQANDRCAMAYLADVRAVVGGTDFVCMVHNVTQMKQQLDEARGLLGAIALNNGISGTLYKTLDAWLEATKP